MTELDDASYTLLAVLYEAYGLSNHFDIQPGTMEFDRLKTTVKNRYPTDIEIATAVINKIDIEFPKQMGIITLYCD